MEQVHPKYRGEMALYAETVASGVGIALVSLNGFLMNNWVQNQIFTAVLILFFFPLFYRMPERTGFVSFFKPKAPRGAFNGKEISTMGLLHPMAHGRYFQIMSRTRTGEKLPKIDFFP